MRLTWDLWTRELDTGVRSSGDMLSGPRTKLQRQAASLRLPRGSELLFRDVALTIVSTRRTQSPPLGVTNQSDWTSAYQSATLLVGRLGLWHR
jgi:hypothetical protein